MMNGSDHSHILLAPIMFIAHLPAGYLLGKAATKQLNLRSRQLVLWTSIGGILPDADMLYFYLVDSQSTHHRHYLSHWPITWLALLALATILLSKKSRLGVALFGISIGGLLHMILDSVAAPIFWLAPFSKLQVELIEIPAIYENYIWSFVLHWTFAIEILICSIAIGVFLKSRRPPHQIQT
ncbi:inner membrane protein [Pseudovibrio denitrificans]|uniref:Inner membrane protein n=3 Tax=Pseudovibrio denitrificans TaxID=258256 RepID=A0A1I7AJK9_9HYPH|nr:inner membrane protein [Pseudovibrio denitrificans]